MLEKIVKTFLIFLIPLKIFSQDTITIHSSRDKTILLAAEKLGNKNFVFFFDSTFFDKRIKCKVFDDNAPYDIKEFFITPKLFTFQDGFRYQIVSDKLIFLSFIDYRNDIEGDIYSQLIDENGILWDSSGIPVCIQRGSQKNINLASDDKNIFIVWEDLRSDRYGDIYAQKFDYFGNALWKENGIAVSNLEGVESEPKIVSNNSGGCYISWIEKILKINKVYVQHLNNSGQKLYGQFGVYISNPEGNSLQHYLLTDSKDDVIIFYSDVKSNSKISFQKLSKKGLKKLGVYGRELCTKPGNQKLVSVTKFSKDEFVVLFFVEEKPGTKSAYIQVLSQGEKLKFKTPIRIHSDCVYHQVPKLSIEKYGFFIYWTCFQKTSDKLSLFVQTVSSKGEILKVDGLKIDDGNLGQSAKLFLFFDNPIKGLISEMNRNNGIYLKHFYLSDYKNPKIQNFNINYYEGHVKLSWVLVNEQLGTRLILERYSQGDNDWTIIYDYISNKKSLLKQMSFDDQIYRSENLRYRLRLIDQDGNENILEEELTPNLTPDGFFLYQNSPNPFTKSTKISFQLPLKSRVVIKLYNSRLEEIATILDEIKNEGLHEFDFYPLPSMESGVYFYRISSAGFYDVKKMIYSK